MDTLYSYKGTNFLTVKNIDSVPTDGLHKGDMPTREKSGAFGYLNRGVDIYCRGGIKLAAYNGWRLGNRWQRSASGNRDAESR